METSKMLRSRRSPRSVWDRSIDI